MELWQLLILQNEAYVWGHLYTTVPRLSWLCWGEPAACLQVGLTHSK